MTFPLAVSLAELRSPLEKRYRNTVYCADTLAQDETGKLRGKYCGNRWCLVCNRVRTARSINRYLQPISSWSDPHLLTLTRPNVKAHELAVTINQMLHDLVAVGRALRRTEKLHIRAIRKIECTYNQERDDYHPHFHIAVESRKQAEAMLRRWLALYPDASPAAQDIRACNSSTLKELFKYFTKLIAKRPDSSSPARVAPIAALDVIFSAMVGRRVYQTMGFKLPPLGQDENEEIGPGETHLTKRPGEEVLWEWMQELHDWVDRNAGELLTGYEPTDGYATLVANIGG